MPSLPEDLTYFTVTRSIHSAEPVVADVRFDALVQENIVLATLPDEVLEVLLAPVYGTIEDGVLMSTDDTVGVSLMSAREIFPPGGLKWRATFYNTSAQLPPLVFAALPDGSTYDLKDAQPVSATVRNIPGYVTVRARVYVEDIIDFESYSGSYVASETARDGTTNDSAVLDAADTAAIAADKPLMLLTGVHKVTSDITLTSPMLFQPGAIIKPASSVTVTLTGGVTADSTQQLFDLSDGGKVLATAPVCYPEWWGAVGDDDGATDSGTALQYLFRECANYFDGVTVHIPTGRVYGSTKPIYIRSNTYVYGGGEVKCLQDNPGVIGCFLAIGWPTTLNNFTWVGPTLNINGKKNANGFDMGAEEGYDYVSNVYINALVKGARVDPAIEDIAYGNGFLYGGGGKGYSIQFRAKNIFLDIRTEDCDLGGSIESTVNLNRQLENIVVHQQSRDSHRTALYIAGGMDATLGSLDSAGTLHARFPGCKVRLRAYGGQDATIRNPITYEICPNYKHAGVVVMSYASGIDLEVDAAVSERATVIRGKAAGSRIVVTNAIMDNLQDVWNTAPIETLTGLPQYMAGNEFKYSVRAVNHHGVLIRPHRVSAAVSVTDSKIDGNLWLRNYSNVSTTLASTAASGAATLSLTAALPRGQVLIGTEYITITAVTGSGPYTATLAAVTAATHTSGATVAVVTDGSPGTITQTDGATTLAATASIGASTLSLTAALPVGQALVNAEYVQITNVTGNGPYTAKLAAVTAAGHTSGTSIASRTDGFGDSVEYAFNDLTSNPIRHVSGTSAEAAIPAWTSGRVLTGAKFPRVHWDEFPIILGTGGTTRRYLHFDPTGGVVRMSAGAPGSEGSGGAIAINDSITLADGATTIDASGGMSLAVTANTGATTINNLTGGQTGQIVGIKGDTNTTVGHLTGGGTIRLRGGVNYTFAANEILLLVYNGGWYEAGRGSASIVGLTGTTAQFNTALSDSDFVTHATIPALTAKTVPVAADKFVIADSAASDALKRMAYSDLLAAIAATIVGGAPGALDTLDELAAALADDASYATTITNALALKAPLISPSFTTPALDTPSSGTLTNCTGLPVAGITSSTSTALGVGSVEVGHATDTTVSRDSAGVLAVEGVVIPTVSSTSTLTNKTLTSPTLTAPALGTAASGDVSACTAVTAATASTIAQRNSSGNLLADAFIPSYGSITSSAGTTPLTADSAQFQVVTGSAAHTIDLPSAPGWWVIINDNSPSGSVTVRSSGGNSLVTVGAGRMGLFFAQTASPTAASDWSWIAPTTDGTLTGIVPVTDTGGWLTIKGVLAYRTQVPTAGTTTTMTSSSAQIQEATGTQVHTFKLPSSGVYAGMPYTFPNNSTQTITIQSSGANTIDTVASGTTKVFYAQKDSPTAAADWIVK